MNTQEASAFGALLRRHRQAAGLTQEELAERARLSARAVIDLERGARLAPRRETVQWLADALVLAPAERRAFEDAARRRPLSGAPGEGLPPGSAPEDPSSSPAPYGGFLGALPAGPLVGRERELGRVLAALDRAAAGHAHLVLLTGEPGIGKTRLAQEVMLRAGERGFRALVGRCYEQHAALPFSPFVEILTAAYALASPSLRQEAPRRFTYLARLIPDQVAGPPPPESDEVRLRVMHAVGGFLAALAADRPLAILLDDLHWADSASLDLLQHLARQLQGARALVLGTYRDVEVNRQHPLERALTDLARERLVEEIDLRGLPVEGTAALIGAHLGTAEVPGELAALVQERTEGNPFFTEEVLAALVEQVAISEAGTDWDRQVVRRVEVPRSIRSVVGQRVGRLAEGAQEVLRAASVLGQEWDLAVLVGMTGQDEDVVLDGLDAAFAARLLEERRVGRRERYGFAHALIGQALYEEVPRYRLRRLHLRAGEALERLRGEQPEVAAELARHFLAAGEEERALRYAVRAGDHAASLYANAEAAQQYQAALELLEAAGDAAGMARLDEKLGEALRHLWQNDAALEVLERAAATWQAIGDLESLARVLTAISVVHMRRGTAPQGLARVQPWMDRIETHASPAALAALLEGLAQLRFACGHFAEYLTVIQRAEALVRELDDTQALARVVYEHGNALQLLGHVGAAFPRIDEAIRLAEAAGDDEYLSLALVEKGQMLYARGEFGEAERLCQRAIDRAERMGDPHLAELAYLVRDTLFVAMGRWEATRQSLERTVPATGGIWGTAGHLLTRGSLLLPMGEWDDAARSLDKAITLCEPFGDLQGRRFGCAKRAELDILQGDPAMARAHLLPLLDRPGLEEFDVTFFLPVLAWAFLEMDDLPRAERTIGDAVRRARAEQLRLALVDALRVQAMVLIRQRRWDEARDALEEGLMLARDMPYPYAEGRLLRIYGNLHAQRGEPERAREQLGTALTIFRQLGARKDQAQTEQLLATLR